MVRPRVVVGWLLPLLCLVIIHGTDPCASINDEGRVFRQRVEHDPRDALSNWVLEEDTADPCDWFGVRCENGNVVALDYRIATVRRFLRGGTSHNTKRHVLSPAPSPSSPVTKGSENDTKPHVSSPAPSPNKEGKRNKTSHLPPSSPAPSPISVSSIPTQSPAPERPISSPTLIRQNNSMPKSNFESSVLSPVTPNRNSSSGSHVPPTVPSQSPLSVSSKSSKGRLSVYIVAGTSSLFFLAFLAVCFHFYHVKKVVTVKPWTTGLSGQLQKAFVTGVPQLKRTELETACEDFSNIIGSLSNCMLYKGTLSSGVEIAVASTLVTSAKKWSKHSETQFRNKIAILSKVNHKNFVNLLGYCEEEEPFTRMMVFEYAPNGTLFEHLHVKEAEGLDWVARLRIVMGISYCLEHMHQLNPPVILGNLRSPAIYLTDDLAAKISDLDFSSDTTTTKLASNNTGLLSEEAPCMQGVMYDFGILLLEIITGRLPYSEEDGLLSDWASDYLKGSTQLRDITDPTLKTLRDEDLRAICEVIRQCCSPDPPERPTAVEVSARLRAITDVTPVGAVPRSSALWWAELEILSTEAN